MKLGTQTGSLVNHFMSQGASKAPQIGDGATLLGWTDRYPATVFFIDQVKKIVGVKEDIAERTDKNGMSEVQEYKYTPDPDGYMKYFKMKKDGSYVPVVLNPATGRWKQVQGKGLIIGRREKYYDFSF